MNTGENVIYKLPVSYGREDNVVTNAFVDRDLLPYLAKFKWFLSDTKRAKTPKTQMRIKGVPRVMLLNRVVFTLEALDDEHRAKLTDRVNVETFYKLVERQPKLKFKHQDPFDCRIDNIDVALRGIDESAFAGHNENEDLVLDNIVDSSEAESLEKMLDARAEELKRRKLEEEQRKREVPDVPLVDLPGVSASYDKDTITKSAEEQQKTLDQFFGMVSEPQDKSAPSKPPF